MFHVTNASINLETKRKIQLRNAYEYLIRLIINLRQIISTDRSPRNQYIKFEII